MFLAARAGAGGKGNHFFASDLQPTPRIAELGAEGEKFTYSLELSSIAHFGLVCIRMTRTSLPTRVHCTYNTYCRRR